MHFYGYFNEFNYKRFNRKYLKLIPLNNQKFEEKVRDIIKLETFF